jgi:hypothetical protein
VGHAARLGATLNIRARVTSFDAVYRMVETGAGVGIVPTVTAGRCRRGMKVDIVRLSDPWAKRRLAICVRQLSGLPAGAQRLVEHLRQAAPARRLRVAHATKACPFGIISRAEIGSSPLELGNCSRRWYCADCRRWRNRDVYWQATYCLKIDL